MKKPIRFTESHLHRIVRESVNKLIKESINNNDAFLYRWVELDSLLNIIASDSMKSAHHEGYNYNKDANTTHNGICFTRDKKYKPYVEYQVQMVFPVQNLLNKSRGLKLIPYQDSRWDDLDEYEERLISKNGKDFVIPQISKIVSAVYIHIDVIIEEVFENQNTNYAYVLKDIEDILNNNIFGDKLKFLYDWKEVPINTLDDFENFIPKVVDDIYYCVRTDDDEEEYFNDKESACASAKELYEEEECGVTVIECYDDEEIRTIIYYDANDV